MLTMYATIVQGWVALCLSSKAGLPHGCCHALRLRRTSPSAYHQMTNDPLSGKSSVMSLAHDRAYKRLIMGTMVNISCEPSLYEELEGQVRRTRCTPSSACSFVSNPLSSLLDRQVERSCDP